MLSKPLYRVVILAQLLALLIIAQALAGQVQLAWDAPTTRTDGSSLSNLAGYTVYSWVPNAEFPESFDVGNQTAYTLTDLTEGGTYNIAVTAYDIDGQESIFSNFLTVTVGTDSPAFVLNVSPALERSNPVPFAGQTVSGDIFVFTAPDSTGITQVDFWLDDSTMSGTPTKTEKNAPYDLAGTAADGTALPYDTTSLTDGTHHLTARIAFSTGSTQVITSHFTVNNSAPAPPLVAEPSSLQFTGQMGGTNPPAQGVNVLNSDDTATTFTAHSNQPWLVVTPTAGVVPAGGSTGLSMAINLTGLAASTYSGTVTVSDDTNVQDAATIDVTLVVTDSATFALHLSTTPDRSSPLPLAGQTISGEMFVFTAPDSVGITQVDFWLDDLTMSGTPLKIERLAPYDLAGTAADGTALPYDTALLTSGAHSITARITSSSGSSQVVSANFTVAEKEPVNQPPVALADAASTPEQTPISIAVLANDSDPDGDTVSIMAATHGTSGMVTHNGTAVTYSPKTTFVGTDSFLYTITDPSGATATATVTVTVTAINRVPVAQADAASTPEQTPISIAVLANDSDPDGDALTITTVTQGAYGEVIIDSATVIYIPDADFVGTDSFTYAITDNQGGEATATVTVRVMVMVQFEAEVGTLYTPMEIGTGPDASESHYITVSESLGDSWDSLQKSGYARYSFTVPKTDAYVLWGRVSPNTTEVGSFFFGFDVQDTGFISDVSPASYQIAPLSQGETLYVDHSSFITAMPTQLDGLVGIKTAHADKKESSAKFLTFTTLQDATLYVAYDATAHNFPTWLTASFTRTGLTIQTSRDSLAVWQREIPAGTMTLPGNAYQGAKNVKAQYVVLFDFHGEESYLVWNVVPPQDLEGLTQPWFWDQAAFDSTPIFFLESGSHTLIIKHRESGTRLDRLIITNDLDLIPTD